MIFKNIFFLCVSNLVFPAVSLSVYPPFWTSSFHQMKKRSISGASPLHSWMKIVPLHVADERRWSCREGIGNETWGKSIHKKRWNIYRFFFHKNDPIQIFCHWSLKSLTASENWTSSIEKLSLVTIFPWCRGRHVGAGQWAGLIDCLERFEWGSQQAPPTFKLRHLIGQDITCTKE